MQRVLFLYPKTILKERKYNYEKENGIYSHRSRSNRYGFFNR
uniref:Uncharacterized protein n=1 Tax=Siphoviridae sp. ctRuT6 TaxID=2826339 RepID=A0A8S5N2R1_9CAUD|nr:MAG TPA: hypothetical protein [Siphoviridae sp. ctRuT6]